MKTPKSKKASTKKSPMLQIHGKDESETKRVAYSLDDILGENLSIYTAKSSDEYRSQLCEMNMTDLQSHAYKIGLVPTDDRRILTDRLNQEFIKWNSRHGSNVAIGKLRSIEDLDSNARKILREGA